MSPQDLARFLMESEYTAIDADVMLGDGRLIVARHNSHTGKTKLLLISEKEIQEWLFQNPAS